MERSTDVQDSRNNADRYKMLIARAEQIRFRSPYSTVFADIRSFSDHLRDLFQLGDITEPQHDYCMGVLHGSITPPART